MNDVYMYRKVLLSSFRSDKVEYCTTSSSRYIEENALILVNEAFFTSYKQRKGKQLFLINRKKSSTKTFKKFNFIASIHNF